MHNIFLYTEKLRKKAIIYKYCLMKYVLSHQKIKYYDYDGATHITELDKQIERNFLSLLSQLSRVGVLVCDFESDL